MREAALLRADGEAKLREARHLECEAWNARLFCGDSAQPSPTIMDAIDGGYGRLEFSCHRCRNVSYVDLAKLRRRQETELWKLEASLVCEHCRKATGRRTQAFFVGVAETSSTPEPYSPQPGAAAAGKPPR